MADAGRNAELLQREHQFKRLPFAGDGGDRLVEGVFLYGNRADGMADLTRRFMKMTYQALV